MKTNNYYNLVKGWLTYYTANNTVYSVANSAPYTFVDIGGNSVTGMYKEYVNAFYTYESPFYGIAFHRIDALLTTLSGSVSSGGVIFGNGTVEPTVDDYCLSGDLITTLSYNSIISHAANNDGSASKTATFTVTNSGSEPVTISEIAYVCEYKGNSSTIERYILLDRTLLDEPVTIPAGGVGQVTYSITFNVS